MRLLTFVMRPFLMAARLRFLCKRSGVTRRWILTFCLWVFPLAEVFVRP